MRLHQPVPPHMQPHLGIPDPGNFGRQGYGEGGDVTTNPQEAQAGNYGAYAPQAADQANIAMAGQQEQAGSQAGSYDPTQQLNQPMPPQPEPTPEDQGVTAGVPASGQGTSDPALLGMVSNAQNYWAQAKQAIFAPSQNDQDQDQDVE